jgi:uncharacterized membrane protein
MPGAKASKRIKRELMAEHPAMLRSVQHELFQGPLPNPEMLEGYKKTDPSFPERIVRMAEAHNAADVKAKNRFSLSGLIVPVIGQVFTLILGAGGIIACVYLAKAGFTGGAITAIAGSFSPMIINAFKGLRQDKK